MRPKTETQTRFTDHFPSFQPNTHKLDILRHIINIGFILQKNHSNSWTVIFELNNKIIQLPHLIFYINRKWTDLQLGKSSDRGTRKAMLRSVTVYSKKLSRLCNLTVQIEQVHDNKVFVIIVIGLSRKSNNLVIIR